MRSPPDFRAFTSTAASGGLLSVLKNRCRISQAFHPASGDPAPQLVEFDAIWDTGATNSVITEEVVNACALSPIGMVQTHGIHGSDVTEVYLVNIYLPNMVAFSAMRVSKGRLFDAQILIGMDVISQGDFAVTNFNGLTKFSYRIPSKRHIDFVQEYQNLEHQYRQGKSKKKR
jgi:hypothetical protein